MALDHNGRGSSIVGSSRVILQADSSKSQPAGAAKGVATDKKPTGSKPKGSFPEEATYDAYNDYELYSKVYIFGAVPEKSIKKVHTYYGIAASGNW